jgi:peroxiredoxin
LLEQLAIPGDYQVVLQDQDGQPIPFDRFKLLMASRPFDVSKDTAGHRATLKLQSDAAVAQAATASKHPKPMRIQGQAFPAFHATTLDGRPVSLETLRGKPFVANFFFALCAPCIAETPALSAFHRAHPEIPVIAFTYDDATTAGDFARTRHFNWPIVADAGALATQAGVAVYPVLMLVDARGVVTKAVHPDAIRSAGKILSAQDLAGWVDANR